MTHHARALRILLIAVILPLLVSAVALAVTLVAAIHSPSSIPVHYGPSGEADGYGSPFTFPILIAAIDIPLVVILGGVAVLVSGRRPFTIMLKTLSIASLWLPIALGVIFCAASIASQTGTIFEPRVWVPIGFGTAVVICVGGWFTLPPRVRQAPAAADPTPAVTLRADERASWIRSTSASLGLILIFIGICVFVAGLSAFALITTNGRLWEITLVPVILMIFTLATFSWHIRVDARGVDVRSAVGLPRFRYSLEDVVSAEARQVDAFSEFGGWGLRWGLNGRVGIILKSGEALEIRRKKGLALVVTVEDAAAGAALLNGLVAQRSVAK